MWRQTETDAVLYTEDRQTLNSLLAYARFPYRDAGRAMTYTRSNGRVYGWQFTIPAEIWNGVVRHLGRQSVTMLDMEPGRRRPVEPQPELPLVAVQPEPPAPSIRTQAVGEKKTAGKQQQQPEAPATEVPVTVAAAKTAVPRTGRTAKPAAPEAEPAEKKVAQVARTPKREKQAPSLPTAAPVGTLPSTQQRGKAAAAKPAVGESRQQPSEPTLPAAQVRTRAPRQAGAGKPTGVEVEPEKAAPVAKQTSGKSAPVAAPKGASVSTAPTEKSAQVGKSVAQKARSSAVLSPLVEPPPPVVEKPETARARTKGAVRSSGTAVTASPAGAEILKVAPVTKQSPKTPAPTKRSARPAAAAVAVSEPVVAPAPVAPATARKRGRKPSE